MKIKVMLFGMLADAAGQQEIQCENIRDTDSLRNYFIQKYPTTEASKFLIAINRKITRENLELNDQDTIALLPPYSGG